MNAVAWLPAVAAAGGAGAWLRYRATVAGARRSIRPHRVTAAVNLAGSAVFGALTGAVLWHGLAEPAYLVLAVGLCGGMTTFSTSVVETITLARAGRRGVALAQALGTLAGSLAAAAAGLALAASWPGG